MAALGYFVPGDDAFDTVAWDPDLPSVIKAPDESPEPVAIKPQPLSYTTVGSVVSTNSLPQLSAPNRIQREGANRRPLMSLIQNLPSSNPGPRRAAVTPLNMANSMHYAQQMATRPVIPDNQSLYSTSSSRTAPTNSTMGQGTGGTMTPQTSTTILSDREKDALLLQFGAYQGIQAIASGATSPVKQAKVMQLSKYQEYIVRDLRNGPPLPVQGLEKMQTLQRLAKFDNPMQQHARNRLSEFSVSRSQVSSTNPIGELDRQFTFPHQGTESHSTPQTNPLLGATNHNYSSYNQQANGPPGYPQPLTAGPPGQRHAPPPAIIRALKQKDSLASNGGREGQWYNSMGVQQGNSSSQEYNVHQQTPQDLQIAQAPDVIKAALLNDKIIVDTLPHMEVQKYYPHGFHASFNGYYIPVPFDVRCDMANGTITKDAEKQQINKENMRDNYFYYGQRRLWGMTVEDHMHELSNVTTAREFSHKDAPLPPRRRFTESIIPQKFSPEDINNMSVAEAIHPLLNAAVATMLSLYDRGPGSARDYNKFSDANPEWIDSNVEGAKSLFGEDWGRVPKGKAKPRLIARMRSQGSRRSKLEY